MNTRQKFIEHYEARVKSLSEGVAKQCNEWAADPSAASYDMAWRMEGVMQNAVEIRVLNGIIDQVVSGDAMVDVKEMLTEKVIDASSRLSRSTSLGHNLRDELEKQAIGRALHDLRWYGEFDDAEKRLFVVTFRKTTYTTVGKGKKAVTTAEHKDIYDRVLALSLRQAFKQAQEMKVAEGFRFEKVEEEATHELG